MDQAMKIRWGKYKYHLLTILLLLFLLNGNLRAEWIEDGSPICRAYSNQYNPKVKSTGSETCIITWEDYRDGTFNIYAQEIDVTGNSRWITNGIAVCSALGDQRYPELIRDGFGGTIIVWYDNRDYNNDIYAQKLDSSGNIQWASSGVAVCTASGQQVKVKLTSDNTGGAIITWWDDRNDDQLVYVQRISSTGEILWLENGIAISPSGSFQRNPQLLPDGAGGAFIVWQDYITETGYDLFAQRINSDGNFQWANGGVSVSSEWLDQEYPQIIQNGAGSIIIAWHDSRSETSNDIYAQKIDSEGNTIWTAGGVGVCTVAESQITPQLVADGAGGAFITWTDSYRNDIYAQRIDDSGTVQWHPNGVAICTANYTQTIQKIGTFGDGESVIVWEDNRNGSDYDIYAQKIDREGIVQWIENGVPVCTDMDNQYYPEITSASEGGFVVTWYDHRSGVDYDIYAQRIDISGNWGFPRPTGLSVTDIPKDQGGKVTIAWNASQRDHFPERTVTHYSIWRSLTAGAYSSFKEADIQVEEIVKWTNLLSENPAMEPLISNKQIEVFSRIDKDFQGTALVKLPSVRTAYAWEWIANQDAMYLDRYAYSAPTHYDSMATDPGYHHFIVAAHTEDPFTFWVSDPDSGYSIDNLAPLQPAGFVGTQESSVGGLQLIWETNCEMDLSHYNLYKGSDEYFVPDLSSFIGSTPDTIFFDESWVPGIRSYYKLSAVDTHGNEGVFASLEAGEIEVETLLQTFSTSIYEFSVRLTWTLSHEIASDRFYLLRAKQPGADYFVIENFHLTSEELDYTFVDKSCEPGATYNYRVMVSKSSGSDLLLFETNPISIPSGSFVLSQNHPNPFNPSTVINYYLPAETRISLEIFDVEGRRVVTLVNRTMVAGHHKVEWDARTGSGNKASSGVYFYRLIFDGKTISKKMILLK